MFEEIIKTINLTINLSDFIELINLRGWTYDITPIGQTENYKILSLYNEAGLRVISFHVFLDNGVPSIYGIE